MDRIGPGMWLSLHALAEEFHNDPELYQRLVIALFRKIPCQACVRDSFNYLTRNKVTNPMEWICKFHNYVNRKLEKKCVPCQKFPMSRVRGRGGKI